MHSFSDLPGMTKRRVAQVVRQTDGFDQILIQPQCARDGAPQLRNLQRMGQAGAKQVTLMVQKNLCFIDQAAKCIGMDDTITVALEFCAGGGGILAVATPTRLGWIASVGCKCGLRCRQDQR